MCGAWRTQDGKFPIDNSGTLPDGRRFEGPRGLTELLASEKERAEHVMLVDLARNDLGRVCVAGTVRVERSNAPRKRR